MLISIQDLFTTLPEVQVFRVANLSYSKLN